MKVSKVFIPDIEPVELLRAYSKVCLPKTAVQRQGPLWTGCAPLPSSTAGTLQSPFSARSCRSREVRRRPFTALSGPKILARQRKSRMEDRREPGIYCRSPKTSKGQLLRLPMSKLTRTIWVALSQRNLRTSDEVTHGSDTREFCSSPTGDNPQIMISSLRQLDGCQIFLSGKRIHA